MSKLDTKTIASEMLEVEAEINRAKEMLSRGAIAGADMCLARALTLLHNRVRALLSTQS
jgi:hypothetical protein